MPPTAHPFATAGGGTLFEYKVATLLAVDMIRSRYTELGGVVVAFEMQAGSAGFEDLLISLELVEGGHRTVHAQCRHVQRFTGADTKFATLLTQAASALLADEASFASEERRFTIVVDRDSPGHVSMAKLCELARAANGYAKFLGAVDAHAGQIAKRWSHCLQAAEGMDPALLYRVLAAFEVHAVEVRTAVTRDSVELINRLAQAWDPPNQRGAVNLANALFKHLTETGPVGGVVDMRSLQGSLRAHLPLTVGAATRRAILGRRRDAGTRRVAMTLRAIGLEDDEASVLAARALAASISITPSMDLTVVSGPMGVGKTTELERLHRDAIDRALRDANAPIPVFLHAKEVGSASLDSVVTGHVSGLGDPSRVGVHLVIDGLDEAGVRISEIAARVATLVASWPNSTVVIASRPESSQLGLDTVAVEPLSQEVATALMAMIDPHIDRWPVWRPELSEVLRRPLFAIRYALDHRKSNFAAVREAQLVDSVGRHAIDDLGDIADGIFELLARMACRVVDSGGQSAELRSLEATPLQIGQIARSRIVHVADGRASFQLAVLTEWFAANALLRDPDVLALSVSSPLRSHRWRYALVQALLQGSAEAIDTVISTMLAHAPATAAWVYHHAKAPYNALRANPLAASALEAGERVRRAERAWIEPWPKLVESWTLAGEMPALGVAMEGSHLVTAWSRNPHDVPNAVVPLPPLVHPLGQPNPAWTGEKAGTPNGDVLWPWDWTFDGVQHQVERWIANRDLLAEIEVCWPELAWDYAHQILKRSPEVQSKPILRDELEAAVTGIRNQFPDSDVHVISYRGGWRLSEAEAFLGDLHRLDVREIVSPWPPPNTRGSWTWSWWTTDQLLARLRLATSAALDVYQAIVDRHVPSMAAELNTYQLLPARIVGTLTPGTGEGLDSEPHYSWHLEPLPAGAANEAVWQLGETNDWNGSDWEKRIGVIRSLRGDVAERVRSPIHGGEPQVLSSTPAGSLALALLAGDLYAFNWTRNFSRLDMNSKSTRPLYG